MDMDWGLLHTALLGFKRDFSNSTAELDRQIAGQRWQDAERLAHSIKGMAKSIGADELHEIAKQLESELRVGEYPSKKRFQVSLAQTLANISALPEPEPAPAAVGDVDRLPLLLAHLRQLLERSGYVAPELLEELKPHLANAIQRDQFEKLSTQIRVFDYSAAQTSLLALATLCRINTEE